MDEQQLTRGRSKSVISSPRIWIFGKRQNPRNKEMYEKLMRNGKTISVTGP
jgi:hypothetical protein